MRILSFASCYPSVADPLRGAFIRDRLAAMARHAEIEVVHSCAWFPLYGGHLPIPPDGVEAVDGMKVHHRRFFYLPGVGRSAAGWFYGRSLLRWLRSGGFERDADILSACRAGVSPAPADTQRGDGREADETSATREDRGETRTGRLPLAHTGKMPVPRPDVLDAHFSWPDGVGVAYTAARLGIPFVVTLRGEMNSRLGSRSMRRQITDALHEAAAVISLSDEMADICIRELGICARKITVVPNGVNTELFRPIHAAEARRALGLPEGRRYVVSVAHLIPQKGLSELVRATAQLPPDVHCLLVGGDMDGGEYRGNLSQLARRCGCADRVTFAGAQDRPRIPMYLSAADVSVLASYAEGCPNVVLESLACGRPVVATEAGQSRQIIRPGKNGLLVPARNEAALAAAIREALGQTWDAEAIRCSPAVCSWQDVAERTLAVFRGARARA